ncbi:MAG: hypothetical protein LBR26_17880 [Prevotella sp.]|jgi:hypothetical protein|nr:hypothetical protein [Prevotella sp.]
MYNLDPVMINKITIGNIAGFDSAGMEIVELPDSVIDKYPDVFRNIFVKTGRMERYNIMTGIDNANTVETP